MKMGAVRSIKGPGLLLVMAAVTLSVPGAAAARDGGLGPNGHIELLPLADADGDGNGELLAIVKDDDRFPEKKLVALRGSDGSRLWSRLASWDTEISFGDLSGDGREELILHDRERDVTNLSGPVSIRRERVTHTIAVIDAGGRRRWRRTFDEGFSYGNVTGRSQVYRGRNVLSEPVVAQDVDGDGAQDLFVKSTDWTLVVQLLLGYSERGSSTSRGLWLSGVDGSTLASLTVDEDVLVPVVDCSGDGVPDVLAYSLSPEQSTETPDGRIAVYPADGGDPYWRREIVNLDRVELVAGAEGSLVLYNAIPDDGGKERTVHALAADDGRALWERDIRGRIGSVGDANGDGWADLREEDARRGDGGRTTALSIRTIDGRSGEVVWERSISAGDLEELACCTDEDLNGDGILDVVSGRLGEDGVPQPETLDAVGIDGSSGHVLWTSNVEGDVLPSSLLPSSDVNGDAAYDLRTTTWGSDPVSMTLYDGSTGERLWTQLFPADDGPFVRAHDVIGDAAAEIVLSFSTRDDEGSVVEFEYEVHTLDGMLYRRRLV